MASVWLVFSAGASFGTGSVRDWQHPGNVEIQKAVRDQSRPEAQAQKQRFQMRWLTPPSFKRNTAVDRANAEKDLQPLGFTADEQSRDPNLMHVDDCGQSCFYKKANQWITMDQRYSYELVKGALAAYQSGNYDGVFRSFGAICSNIGTPGSRTQDDAKKCLQIAGSDRARNMLAAGKAKLDNADSALRLHGGVELNSSGQRIEELDPDAVQPVYREPQDGAYSSTLRAGKQRVGVTRTVYIPTLARAPGSSRTDGDLDREYRGFARKMTAPAYEAYRKIEFAKGAGVNSLELGRAIQLDPKRPVVGSERVPGGENDSDGTGAIQGLNANLEVAEKNLSKDAPDNDPNAGIGSQEQRNAYLRARETAIAALEAHSAQLAGTAPSAKSGAQGSSAPAKTGASAQSSVAQVSGNQAVPAQANANEMRQPNLGSGGSRSFDWDTVQMGKAVKNEILKPISGLN